MERATGQEARHRPDGGVSLRWRLAGMTGAAILLACGLQALAFFSFHSDASPADFLRAGLASLVAAGTGWGVAFLVVRATVQPLEELAATVTAIAGGELTRRVSRLDGLGEIGTLARSFDLMLGGLRGTLAELRDAAGKLDHEAADILGSVTRQAATATQQAAAITQTSTTASEIAQTAKQATEHADSVIQMTQRSEELSQEGLQVVEEAVDSSAALGEQVKRIAATMADLSDRTLQVGEIIATVKDLAEQSNLLALNASIEASKAGEHGRGFAVVALEMRNLAEQSKQAAVQVRAILSEIQKGAREASTATDEGASRAVRTVTLSRSAGEAIEGLAMVIRESALAARQIANNTRQQTIGVEQMVAAISELSTTINESAEGSRAIEQGANALTRVSRRLGDAVRRYRV
ncbi:MAG: methyl-accepting chemotaxis protein [Anaeromyxobacter sp.]|nr:methyl-accepting chemotaxis protein [Anaeromyxobacter sp.]MBL0276229.1 methyl-accepting chemotaxis protein [Anaeromyxobacter sp.]